MIPRSCAKMMTLVTATCLVTLLKRKHLMSSKVQKLELMRVKGKTRPKNNA